MATQLTAPTLADVQEARQRLLGIAEETPIYLSETFSRRCGREVHLKADTADDIPDSDDEAVVAGTLRDIRATLAAFVPGQNVFVINDVADDFRKATTPSNFHART